MPSTPTLHLRGIDRDIFTFINTTRKNCILVTAIIQSIHKRLVWLLPQLNTNYDDYILQLDGAPPHFHRSVWVLLNRVLQQRWTGCAAKWDNHLLPWPPRSPDLTPCDLFLWEFIKGSVYIPPLPMSLNEVRDWITHALQTITVDMLHRVWDEFDYRVDVCRETQGPGRTHWRTLINAWETWTVAAADGVCCARVRWEINF